VSEAPKKTSGIQPLVSDKIAIHSQILDDIGLVLSPLSRFLNFSLNFKRTFPSVVGSCHAYGRTPLESVALCPSLTGKYASRDSAQLTGSKSKHPNQAVVLTCHAALEPHSLKHLDSEVPMIMMAATSGRQRAQPVLATHIASGHLHSRQFLTDPSTFIYVMTPS